MRLPDTTWITCLSQSIDRVCQSHVSGESSRLDFSVVWSKSSDSLDCWSRSLCRTPVNLNAAIAAGVGSLLARCDLCLYSLSTFNHFISHYGYPNLLAFLSPLPSYAKLFQTACFAYEPSITIACRRQRLEFATEACIAGGCPMA